MNRNIKECVRFLGQNLQRDGEESYCFEKGEFSILIDRTHGCGLCGGGWTANIEIDNAHECISIYSKGKTLSECERDAKKKLMPIFKQIAVLLDYDVE